MKDCTQCKSSFQISNEDKAFYDKVSPIFNGKKYSIPEPIFCPICRDQRRMTYRNERKLYHRKCDLTGKQIITQYHTDTPYKVYSKEAWWGDEWDPQDFGRDFDFNRPFFEQFSELIKEVPLPDLVIDSSENSDYTNYCVSNKNCYLLAASDYNEDCVYSSYIFKSDRCFDCLFVSHSTGVYESINCENCQSSQYLQNCNSCSDCMFCYNCRGCKNCIGCVNLRQKQYCIFNEQLSKEDYKKKKKELILTRSNTELIRERFVKFKAKFPYKYCEIEDSIDSSGDYLFGCKNCKNCFDLGESEDCKYTSLGLKVKDCMDSIGVVNSELCLEACASPEDYAIYFSAVVWPKSSHLYYCLFPRSSHNCFGCVSILKNQYCILNKQYTEEEYNQLVPRIIEHMQKTGEWGLFLDPKISPFAYNETVANDYYPLNLDEVKNKGWKWHDSENIKSYKGPDYKISDQIKDVKDDVCKQILICEKTEKPYKIIPQELKFYKEFNLPIPRCCPDQRHLDRMKLRNPRKLYDRKCSKCSSTIKTTYSPGLREEIYCEKCYLKEVY